MVRVAWRRTVRGAGRRRRRFTRPPAGPTSGPAWPAPPGHAGCATYRSATITSPPGPTAHPCRPCRPAHSRPGSQLCSSPGTDEGGGPVPTPPAGISPTLLYAHTTAGSSHLYPLTDSHNNQELLPRPLQHNKSATRLPQPRLTQRAFHRQALGVPTRRPVQHVAERVASRSCYQPGHLGFVLPAHGEIIGRPLRPSKPRLLGKPIRMPGIDKRRRLQ